MVCGLGLISPLVPIWKKSKHLYNLELGLLGMDYCGCLMADWWCSTQATIRVLPGKRSAAGPALVFDVLPKVLMQCQEAILLVDYFSSFLMGRSAELLRSLCLRFQLLNLIDDRKWSRKKATWIVVSLGNWYFRVPSHFLAIEGNFFADISFTF